VSQRKHGVSGKERAKQTYLLIEEFDKELCLNKKNLQLLLKGRLPLLQIQRSDTTFAV
jgi:hypothetical protein